MIKQTYPGYDDYVRHFHTLLEAFHDKRYIKLEEKPIFLIWNPQDLPNSIEMIDLWKKLAIKNGLKGIYFIGVIKGKWNPTKYGERK